MSGVIYKAMSHWGGAVLHPYELIGTNFAQIAMIIPPSGS